MAPSDAADRPHLRAAVIRLFSRRIGGLTGETRAAAQGAYALSIFCLVLTAAYVAFYAVYDAPGLVVMISVCLACMVSYVTAMVLLRFGRQLAGALVVLSGTACQILVCNALVGWHVGLHLYLVSGAHLVFMVFTDRQTVYRWLFIGIATFSFVFCQVILSPEVADYRFPARIEAGLFSANMVVVGLLMFILASVQHYRWVEAHGEARAQAVRAEYLANTDPLTGLENRRPIMERLQTLSQHSPGPYSVAIVDLDRFKSLNDTFGHVCGDNVLTAIGQRLRSRLRGSDAVGRWGGEEFIIVLPDTRLDDATALMDRLRKAIDRNPIECGNHVHHITASFGVADGREEAATHRIIKRADDAMYEAKVAGRNTVRSRVYDLDAEAEELISSLRDSGTDESSQ